MSPSDEGRLSKEEVEALLQATQQQEEPAERPEPVRRIHGYDFQQPSRFNKSQLDALRKANDSLAQLAASHVGRLLRTSVKAQLVSIDQMKWENLLQEAGEAVVAFVFGLDPLGFQGLLTIERRFAAVCLDRMTGGAGEAGEEAVEFTDVDVRTLARLARGFLDPLPELWQNIGRFAVALGQFVQDLQSLDLLPPEEDLVQLSFLLQSSAASGQVALSVPFRAVRSLPPKSEEANLAVALGDEATEAGLRENLRRARVELAVLLGTADIKVRRLVQVEPGDIIVLDAQVGDMLPVRVNDRVKFHAFPGLSKGRIAAKLIMEE
jgi:flagellar motor switch protein FliM